MQYSYRQVSVWTFLLALVAGVLSFGAAPVVAGELKLAHFMSPKHPMDRFIMRPWSKELAELSGGDLTVRIFPAGRWEKGRWLSSNGRSMASPI